MKLSRRVSLCGLALVVAVMAVTSALSLWHSCEAEIESHRSLLVSRGQTVLDALVAGILAHGRMGRYRGDRLAVILEELAKRSGIRALELRDPSGRLLACGGTKGELPEAPAADLRWHPDRLELASRLDLVGACGHGEEGGWRGAREEGAEEVLFEKGIYLLMVSLDVAELRQETRRQRLRLTVSLGVVCVALGLGSCVLVLLLRQAGLATELEREREQTRRQEQLARLGAGLAHETRNPLGLIRGLAQSVGECPQHGCPASEKAARIVDEVDRVVGGINSFLALARPKKASLESVDLDRFFERLLPLAKMDAAAARVAVEYEPCRLRVLADEELLRRAMLNLLLNAFRASSQGQVVSVRAERNGSLLSLRVTDTGCGISADDLPHVTEPYFTRFQGGSGLGLSIADQIAVAHGWTLRLESAERQGTTAALMGMRIVETV